VNVTIMQPAYLPWLGFFDRVVKSDLLIVLDHVAMDRNSKTKYANRNRIRTSAGGIWLTVPLLNRGRDAPLDSIEIDNTQRWQEKHWRSIETSYARAPCYAQLAGLLKPFYEKPWKRLSELDDGIMETLLAALGIRTPWRRSSSMKHEGAGSELILSLCRSAGATRYISGPFGRDYLDAHAFAAAGIRLAFHDYPHPQYSQAYPGFEPYLSVIDLLFNHGEKSLTILRSGEGSLREA
jgi:hypothetical protein